MRHTCVIFDLDGTLIDPRRDLAAAVNLMRREFGLPPLPEQTLFDYLGDGVHKLCERALHGSGIGLEEAIPHMRRHYHDNMLNHTCLYPGVASGLRSLREKNSVLAVASNKPEEFTRAILAGLKIDGEFSFIIGCGESFPRKPAPDALLHIMRQSRCEPRDSYMVGDHHTDMEAGRHAGITRIYVSWGFGNLNGEQPDFRVDNFAGIEKLVATGACADYLAATNSAK